METFLIEGGKLLQGELPVYGAKNHVLKMIPASFLSSESVTLNNIPHIEDVHRLLEIVEKIGGTVKKEGERSIRITPPAAFTGNLPRELVPQLRASLVLLGPLLARYKRVVLPHPGGCQLGKRPIDFFIDGFKQLGASVSSGNDEYIFEAPNGLSSATIIFPSITVTGTETLMMAATLANGTTVLKNAACEPEIPALAEVLNQRGAHISGAGTHTITIVGGSLLQGGEATILPDRIEAGSFVMLAAATNSHIRVTNCEPQHLEVPLLLLKDMGVSLTTGKDWIEVQPSTEPLRPTSVVTHEYPGFPTDLQAPMTIVCTQAKGQSHVRETIYDGRLFYTDTLNNMGAKITLLDPYRIIVDGRTPLRGKTVASPDLRAGIALLIAALSAKGKTAIQNIYQIDRGYERIEQRLRAIGAHIERGNK